MQKNLVIVESPAKAKTIEKFLGDDFVVKSSYGHIRDLDKKVMGINLENGFTPNYEIPSDKKKVVDELSKLSKKVDTVWLASDEDREGESIAWHLATVLGLPIETTKRIVFHEITKSAILNAIDNPRTIDTNLVDAQQARRVLDRLVGYELSPVLWKKLRPGLSAGRVQSVAVRLIVEREREINTFASSSSYRIVAEFYSTADPSKTIFKAEYSKKCTSKEEAVNILERLKNETFAIEHCETKPVKRYPAPPFTTSTLQQEASRKYGMSVSQTMSIAQKLYEQGLITYMRTDSVNLSSLAIGACKNEIIAQFGEEYSSPRNYTTHSRGAQEAHEAIRPSYINRATITGSSAEKHLYELIWKRTVASQMVAADIDHTTVTIGCSDSDDKFIATGNQTRFDGFMKLYSETSDDEQNQDTEVSLLPNLNQGDSLKASVYTATERYSQPPMRYNEATLVKKLEELGIGRPSTYAPTISTIIARGYVEKGNRAAKKRDITKLTMKNGVISEKLASESYGAERNRLFPTDIGINVNNYLSENFGSILDYNFTAKVEEKFDHIADGDIKWNKMIGEFYKPFHNLVETAIKTQWNPKASVRVIGTDPKTGCTVKAKIGRYSPMVEIEGQNGEKSRFAPLKKGQLIETITLEEALNLFTLPRNVGQYNGEDVVIGIGKYGGYVRHGKSFTSLAKADDPYSVTLERAIELIEEQNQHKKESAQPLKTFDQDPEIVIKNGRYGAYIAANGKNYRIPKSASIENLTLEECRNIIAKSKK